MLSTLSSDNKSSKLYIRVVVVGIVMALHGLLLYLFFQYQTPLKIKPQTTQPLEISFIQMKPQHPSQTYHSQPQTVVIHHADPAKQPYFSDNTQAADIKEKPFPTPNPTPAKLVNDPAKDNNHKPIELRPTIDNSTNQKKASQPKTSLSTASQSQSRSRSRSQTQPQKKSRDIPSEPLLNARENNAHYKQQQAAQIERNISSNTSQSLTQPKSATIKSATTNKSHTNADNALKTITHDERAESSAKSSKDSMRPQIKKTPNQPVSPVISAIPAIPAINSSAKPATPITFGNADASWQKRPNTQLPPNLSRIVTLKQLLSLQVKLNVNAQGGVEKCRITQTSGDQEVDKFICQQVQKAKLYPRKANGITVPSIGNLTIALTNLAN